ncbi:MAG: hypothetical protein PQJ60_12950, partial [Spirochaetales bacterium]|nr:hypothetical protein [Spirochaetales bacterium]
WQADVEKAVRFLEENHGDLYHQVSPELFHDEKKRLLGDLAHLSPYERYLRLQRLVALVGDGHTSLSGSFSQSTYPFRLEEIGGEWCVVRAGEEFRLILGARLREVDGKGPEEIRDRLTPYLSHDNQIDLDYRAVRRVSEGELLFHAGVTASPEGADFRFEGLEGEEIRLFLEARDDWGDWLFIDQVYPDFTNRHNTPGFYRFALIEDYHTLYLDYKKCRPDQSFPMKKFTAQVLDSIEKDRVDRVIIDLSKNSGGRASLLRPLMEGLKEKERINRSGYLIVLIGEETFSAAVQNGIWLRENSEALLVGRPTRGNGDHYGSNEYYLLPHTGLQLRCSSRFYDFRTTDSGPLRPDILLREPSLEEYFLGTDPVLEQIFELMDNGRIVIQEDLH